jgi:hypothetical protein
METNIKIGIGFLVAIIICIIVFVIYYVTSSISDTTLDKNTKSSDIINTDIDTDEDTIQCPKGSEPSKDGKKCYAATELDKNTKSSNIINTDIDTDADTIQCPTGSEPSSDGKKCYAAPDPGFWCSPGDDVCYKKCSDGTSSTLCKKDNISRKTDPTISCPKGWINENGLCYENKPGFIRKGAKLYSCPNGYKWNNAECIRNEDILPTMRYTNDDKCHPKDEISSGMCRRQCKYINSEYNGKRCGIMKCAKKFNCVGGVADKTHSNSNSEKYDVHTDPKTGDVKRGGRSRIHVWGCTKDYEMKGNKCYRVKSVVAPKDEGDAKVTQPKCKNGYEEDNGICYEKCPDGYEVSSGLVCVKKYSEDQLSPISGKYIPKKYTRQVIDL